MMVLQLLLTTQPPLLLLLWSGIRGLGIPTTGNNIIKGVKIKTIKTLFASFAFLFLGLVPISAMGQSMPYTFTANTAAKASEVNENFTYLLERFGGIRETTVNCGTSGSGSGINSAIQNGYNSIVINGICKENIKLDGTEGNIPRLLKLRGANNDASQDKIIDNSSYTEHVLTFSHAGGLLVTIDNLTISGGDRGITTWMNVNLLIRNSKVEGYKNRGITLQGNSVMQGENLTIDGSYSGATTEEQGLRMWGGAVAYVENLTITNNQKFGLTMWQSDIEIRENVILTGNGRAINVGKGAVFTSNANINISGSTDRAIDVSQGLFQTWDGTISITNTTGIILKGWMSNIYIKNLTATGDGSSDDIFNISMSVFSLENLSLSSAGGNGIYFHNSDGEIDNLTSSNNKESGIVANRSRIRVENSVFSGNEEDGINLYQASSLELRSSTISSNTDEGIEAEENSTIKVRDSTISNNSNEAIIFGDGSNLYIKNSTISAVSGKQAIHGYNNAVLKILEDSGSTVISTTNNVAIRLSHNSTGQIGSGVEVTSTGTNGYGVQVSRGGLIRIDSGATITGDSSRNSIDGIGGAKIDIDYGATVQSVVCASDNQTMVFLNGSSGNYPSPTIGSYCITVKY